MPIRVNARGAVELLREQEPEFVACTGDVVDLHHYGAAELLRSLPKENMELVITVVT